MAKKMKMKRPKDIKDDPKKILKMLEAFDEEETEMNNKVGIDTDENRTNLHTFNNNCKSIKITYVTDGENRMEDIMKQNSNHLNGLITDPSISLAEGNIAITKKSEVERGDDLHFMETEVQVVDVNMNEKGGIIIESNKCPTMIEADEVETLEEVLDENRTNLHSLLNCQEAPKISCVSDEEEMMEGIEQQKNKVFNSDNTDPSSPMLEVNQGDDLHVIEAKSHDVDIDVNGKERDAERRMHVFKENLVEKIITNVSGSEFQSENFEAPCSKLQEGLINLDLNMNDGGVDRDESCRSSNINVGVEETINCTIDKRYNLVRKF